MSPCRIFFLLLSFLVFVHFSFYWYSHSDCYREIARNGSDEIDASQYKSLRPRETTPFPSRMRNYSTIFFILIWITGVAANVQNALSYNYTLRSNIAKSCVARSHASARARHVIYFFQASMTSQLQSYIDLKAR